MDDLTTAPTPPIGTPIMHQLYFSYTAPNISLPLIFVLLGLLILGLNSLLCHYYLAKNGSVVYDKLFLLLSAADALTGLAAVLQCATLTAALVNDRQTVTMLLPVTSMLSAVAFHTSAFYNVLLAVCRTITLHYPFFTFDMWVLHGVAGLYPLVWGLLAGYEVYSVYENEQYLVERINLLQISPLCGSELIYNTAPDNFPNWAYFVLLLGVPYVIPSIVCSACCCFSLVSLRPCLGINKDSSNTTGYIVTKTGNSKLVRVRQNRNFRATITILQLSAAFFVCNTLFFLTEFTLQIMDPKGIEEFENYIVYTAGNLLPVFNSLINPTILIRRGTKLRNFVNNLFREREK